MSQKGNEAIRTKLCCNPRKLEAKMGTELHTQLEVSLNFLTADSKNIKDLSGCVCSSSLCVHIAFLSFFVKVCSYVPSQYSWFK